MSSLKLTPNLAEAEISRIQSGDIQVIILSPESFECVDVKGTLQSAKKRIHCVAIDEAHCIEEWLVFTYKKLHNCVKFFDCIFFVVPLFSFIKLLCVYVLDYCFEFQFAISAIID